MNIQILKNKKFLIIAGAIILLIMLILLIIWPLKKKSSTKSSEKQNTSTSTSSSSLPQGLQTTTPSTQNAEDPSKIVPPSGYSEELDQLPYEKLIFALPHQEKDFLITYSTDSDTYHITLYLPSDEFDSNNISSQTDLINKQKEKALNWIRQYNIDPNNIKIEYSVSSLIPGQSETDIKLLLPVAQDNFQISYNTQKDRYEIYIFTDYHSGSQDKEYEEAKKAADQWFKDHGVDPSSINIDYFETGH